MGKQHYIATAGIHGCMPNFCGAYETEKDAVASLIEIHDLSRRLGMELRKFLTVELDIHKHRNKYAEVVECDCDNMEDHNEAL